MPCPCFLAGHETTFCALLYCLAKLGVVGTDDAQALVTRVFARYLQLMRKIQVLELEHYVLVLVVAAVVPPVLAVACLCVSGVVWELGWSVTQQWHRDRPLLPFC